MRGVALLLTRRRDRLQPARAAARDLALSRPTLRPCGCEDRRRRAARRVRIGDVVFGLNHRQVRSLEEFNRLLSQQRGGLLGLLVRRGHNDFYVSVDLAGGAPHAVPKAAPARDTLLRT